MKVGSIACQGEESERKHVALGGGYSLVSSWLVFLKNPALKNILGIGYMTHYLVIGYLQATCYSNIYTIKNVPFLFHPIGLF